MTYTEPAADKLPILVARFYELMVHAPRIAHFFKEADVQSLTRKQVWFFSTLLMENNEGTQDYMRESHRSLVLQNGLNDTHFDAMAECLIPAMEETDLPEPTKASILKAAEDLRDAVLYR